MKSTDPRNPTGYNWLMQQVGHDGNEEPPTCDWIKLAYKDRRKGYSWRCRACSHRGGGKVAPKCPCKEIKITPQSDAVVQP